MREDCEDGAPRPLPDLVKARARPALLASGAIYLVLFAVLGALVAHAPPSAFDRAGHDLYDQAEPFAIVASRSGLVDVYLTIALAALAIGVARRSLLPRAVFLGLTLLVSWKISDVCKLVFHRARPEQWLWVHERSPAYPSGHAVLSIAGYGLIAAFAWRSGLPLAARYSIAITLVAWILAIDWSRLALGAHWPTDVIGGILLELGVIQLARAAYDPLPIPRRRSANRRRTAA